jgi:hypothetical protein
MKRVYIVSILLSGIILLMASCEKEQDRDKYVKDTLLGEWALISNDQSSIDTAMVSYVISFDKDSVRIRMPEIVGFWPFLYYADGRLIKFDADQNLCYWRFWEDEVIFADTMSISDRYPKLLITYDFQIKNSRMYSKSIEDQGLKQWFSGYFPGTINDTDIKIIDNNTFLLHSISDQDMKYDDRFGVTFLARRIVR